MRRAFVGRAPGLACLFSNREGINVAAKENRPAGRAAPKERHRVGPHEGGKDLQPASCQALADEGGCLVFLEMHLGDPMEGMAHVRDLGENGGNTALKLGAGYHDTNV
jgi:hypothetical protein